MNNITQLDPKNVWQWFANICAIAHPTFHEEKLAQYFIDRVNSDGQQYGLSIEKDAVGNLRIKKPATKGMEDHAPVAIQAHYDMVAQKGANSTHDFSTDPIQTHIKDGWVWANDTTLGADNGIGLAMGLAVAFSDDIAHPPLTLIITSEEEIGMGGVQGLAKEWLDMPYLLNLDSEDSGELFIGCAGGRDVTFSQTYPTQALTDNTSILQLKISGLHGGHSGIDINKGVANANLLLNRVLTAIFAKANFELISLYGGTLRNVITRDAYAIFVGDFDHLNPLVKQQADIIKQELQFAEENLNIELVKINLDDINTLQQNHKKSNKNNSLENLTSPPTVANATTTKSILNLINAIPNGVIRMSDSFVGVVETSISMGVVRFHNGELSVKSLMRSLGETQKDALAQKLTSLAELSAVNIAFSADYPGWQPDPNSYLLAKGKAILTEYFGQAPKIQVIHAGLECGFLKAKAPQMDMISFGPNIRAAHSPKERIEIASVAQNFEILLKFLAQIPKQ
ncbi:aminoacyl-histidine dipeptidase [Faucicola mancuniensis]|uniref:aminoacyl-histidine dipeptidase n=1 Tax=Faucicola mancuniensis TaxID=1309795 RepID=UPI0039773C9C